MRLPPVALTLCVLISSCVRFCRLLIVSSDIVASFSYDNLKFSMIKDLSSVFCLYSLAWCLSTIYVRLVHYKLQTDSGFPALRERLNAPCSPEGQHKYRGFEWLCLMPGILFWWTWMLALGWDFIQYVPDGTKFLSLKLPPLDQLIPPTMVTASNTLNLDAHLTALNKILHLLHLDDVPVDAVKGTLTLLSVACAMAWVQLLKLSLTLNDAVKDDGKRTPEHYTHKHHHRIFIGIALVLSLVGFIIAGVCRLQESMCRPNTLLGMLDNVNRPVVAVFIAFSSLTSQLIFRFVLAKVSNGCKEILPRELEQINLSFLVLQMVCCVCCVLIQGLQSSLWEGVQLGLGCALLMPSVGVTFHLLFEQSHRIVPLACAVVTTSSIVVAGWLLTMDGCSTSTIVSGALFIVFNGTLVILATRGLTSFTRMLLHAIALLASATLAFCAAFLSRYCKKSDGLLTFTCDEDAHVLGLAIVGMAVLYASMVSLIEGEDEDCHEDELRRSGRVHKTVPRVSLDRLLKLKGIAVVMVIALIPLLASLQSSGAVSTSTQFGATVHHNQTDPNVVEVVHAHVVNMKLYKGKGPVTTSVHSKSPRYAICDHTWRAGSTKLAVLDFAFLAE